MTGDLPDGTRIKKTYTFYPDNYIVGLAIESESKTQGLYADFAVINDKNESSYVFKGPFVFNGKS